MKDAEHMGSAPKWVLVVELRFLHWQDLLVAVSTRD